MKISLTPTDPDVAPLTREGTLLHPYGTGRLSRAKLVNGSVYLHDGGFTDKDRTATVTMQLTSKDDEELLDYWKLNGVSVMFQDNVAIFKARIEALDVDNEGVAAMSLWITERIVSMADFIYPGPYVPAWSGVLGKNGASTSGFAYIDGDGAYRSWGGDWSYQSNPNGPGNDTWTDTDAILSGPFLKVSRGSSFTIALDTSGNVYGWGYNGTRQANPDSATDPWTNESNIISTGCIDIAVGASFALALKANGDVIAWGNNQNKQCNPLSATHPWTDQTNVIISDCTAVFAGGYSSYAIKTNGDVIGWGANIYGQIDPSATNPWIDTSNIITSSISKVSAGFYHALFLKTGGNVVGLGGNPYCDPNYTDGSYNLDVDRVLFSGIDDISCGDVHSIILDSSGNMYCYGSNAFKQSDPDSVLITITDVSTPILTGVYKVLGGDKQTYAIDSDGGYYAWGDNEYAMSNPGSATDPWVSKVKILTLS